MSFENESFEGTDSAEPVKVGRSAEDTLRKLADKPLEQARALGKYIASCEARKVRLTNLCSEKALDLYSKYGQA